MAHKIEISDKTYNELKEYCVLNHIKMGQYADKLLYDSLMIEKYGDTPFTNYKKKIVKEFPPAKFEQEYMAQPEPIHVDTPNPPETIETKFTLKPDGTVVIDGEEQIKALEEIQKDIDNPAFEENEPPKKDFNELYEKIGEADRFKKAYSGKSITTEEETKKPKIIRRRLK